MHTTTATSWEHPSPLYLGSQCSSPDALAFPKVPSPVHNWGEWLCSVVLALAIDCSWSLTKDSFCGFNVLPYSFQASKHSLPFNISSLFPKLLDSVSDDCFVQGKTPVTHIVLRSSIDLVPWPRCSQCHAGEAKMPCQYSSYLHSSLLEWVTTTGPGKNKRIQSSNLSSSHQLWEVLCWLFSIYKLTSFICKLR